MSFFCFCFFYPFSTTSLKFPPCASRLLLRSNELTSTSLNFFPFQLREHLAKGQRTLAGEGMSQIVRSLLELLQRRSYYSGDLLFSTEILRNVTDTFKRATYIPAPDDVQVSPGSS